jgi:hypothetical protein
MGEGQEKICGEGNQSSLQSSATSEIGTATNPNNTRTNIRMRTERERKAVDNGRERQPFIKHWENGSDGHVADTMRPRGEQNNRERKSEFIDKNGKGANWENFPTQSPLCGGDDGLPVKLDGITFSAWRNKSIMGYGNAVVPQLIFQIFKTIELYEQQRTDQMGDMDASEGWMHGMEKQQPGGER